MATIAITPDHDLIAAEIFIAAPPERVFQAITDPRQLPQWWGQEGMYRTTKLEADLQVGGEWRSTGVGADGKAFEVYGKYLEIDPPHLLIYTWIAPWAGAIVTTVRWELTLTDAGTQVRLQHSGFAGNTKAVQDHGNGWQRVLGWMQAFVEKGATVATRGQS